MIAASVDAALVELRPVRSEHSGGVLGFLRTALWALSGSTLIIEPTELPVEGYDLLFVGTPVWYGRPPAPLRRFLSEGRLRANRIALFCCYSVYKGGVFRRLRKNCAPDSVVGATAFRAPLLNDEIGAIERARHWALDIIQGGW